MEYKRIDNNDIEALKKIIPGDRLHFGEDIHPDFSHDEMIIYGKAMPEVVVEAKSTDEVSKVMKYASDNNIPVTPRGAGTGLCGACVPLHSGIVLSLALMNKIIEFDLETMTVTVEPGVLLMELQQAASEKGLLYAPDPGEKSATVGGNVSTNAGGMRAVKYGVTRDYVKGLEVVLPSGEIINIGGKITKNSSGYSLKDLFVGSEGTLGIVTKLILKILPSPKKMVSLLIPFNSLKESLDFVPKVMNLPFTAVTIEFMEKEVLNDSEEYLGKGFPNKNYPAYLIVSYNGNSNEELKPMLDAVSDKAMECGALDVFISDTQERQDAVWSARGAFLEAIKNSTTKMDECDVVVPINKIAEYVDYTRQLAEKYSVRIRSFGHAGDGNLHVYICKDDLSDKDYERINTICMDAFYTKAKELNGQVSGEHGIGHAKKEYLKSSLGETQTKLMQGIKDVFDPKHILNPSKIVD